jgi:hypothetical protein
MIHKTQSKLLKLLRIGKVVNMNNKCRYSLYHNCYEHLHILLPLSFQICHIIISTPRISMWIHSKFNYIIELLPHFLLYASSRQKVYSKIIAEQLSSVCLVLHFCEVMRLCAVIKNSVSTCDMFHIPCINYMYTICYKYQQIYISVRYRSMVSYHIIKLHSYVFVLLFKVKFIYLNYCTEYDIEPIHAQQGNIYICLQEYKRNTTNNEDRHLVQ